MRLLRVGAIMVLLTARTASSVVAQSPFSTPLGRVLVLYSDERLLPANIILDEAIRATFAADTSDRIEFHSEFLDVTRFPGEAQQQRQRDFLRDKYRERPPDVVIAVGGAALEFLLKYRAELFTGVPIVQCSVAGDPHPKNLQDAKIAGVAVPKSASSTLEIAFRLHPDTRQVAVVTGSGPRDREMADEMRGEIDTFQNRAAVMWLSNLSLQELRGELSRLPDHTVVLYLTMFQDAAGASFTPRQALDQFATASRAPIYGFYDTYLGHGIVGGSMVTFEEIGRKAAQLGIRMLADEDAQTAARLESPKATPMFDWHELRRWNISEKQLPPGSAVRFKEATYWEQHYRLILVAGSLCALEAFLISTLLVQLRRRRLAERSLRESEERMSLAADAANVGIWIRDLMGQKIWATDKWRELFGFEKAERLDMHSFLKRLHSGDRDAVSQTLASAEERGGTYEMEYRIVLPDGRVRWISSQGRVEFDDAGKPVLMRGVSLDNTARKQAEQELHERRGELAHLARVTMLGELSGSLAHELNQPLTAILSNAQAAEHYLAQDAPDLAQVREILADVVAEDERAGEVIRRLRLLLRKGEVQQQTLDVNEVVIEVLKLARSDLTSQGVTVDTALASDLGAIRGDGVQLQQVLLNLVMNACDAMADNVAKDRLLTVRTFSTGEASVRIEVSDVGRGLPAGGAERAFERYFTTKTQGLGLGLSVCRTIITAHGGTLGAANNAGRGATFHFTLPLAKKPRA
jgi:PAS domain S-box-containing protein